MKFFPLLLMPFFCSAALRRRSEPGQTGRDVRLYGADELHAKDGRPSSRLEKEMKDLQKAVGSPEAGLRKQVVDLSIASENRDEKIKAILGRLDELESQLRAYWEDMKDELRELKKAAAREEAASRRRRRAASDRP